MTAPADQTARVSTTGKSVVNALSVDIEDWFQFGASGDEVSREDFDTMNDRIVDNVVRLLDLFSEAGASATFFISGSVARRRPDMVRAIAGAGHEVANHGFDHARVSTLDRKAFAQDLEKTRRILEDCTGQPVLGYRAPSFSLNGQTIWAYEELARQNYTYSSSVLPIEHHQYGWSDAPRFAFQPLSWSPLVELPLATAKLGQGRIAGGGVGASRVRPYSVSRWAFRQINRVESRAGVFHCYPSEIDPNRPHLPVGANGSDRKSQTVDGMASRLREFVLAFEWTRLDRLAGLEALEACAPATPHNVRGIASWPPYAEQIAS
ncbi:MAG: XrtA system polysaccharide deacetylase [Erythrobacter sp.]